MVRLTDKDIARFWSKVDIRASSECWNWKAGTAGRRKGVNYGHFRLPDRTVYAHRVAYQVAHGPPPDGLVVRHKCDNGLCVNPDHLVIGTQEDNAHDTQERGRHRYGVTPGHLNALAVFDEVSAREVARRYYSGMSAMAISIDMGFNYHTTLRLINGSHYKEFRHLFPRRRKASWRKANLV